MDDHFTTINPRGLTFPHPWGGGNSVLATTTLHPLPQAMPSSRRPRTRARAPLAGPGPIRPQCRALLADETTHCSARAQGHAEYCTVHGREYAQLTGLYKLASSRVDGLEPEIRKARTTVAGLGTVVDVDAAVALAKRYLDALGEEIDGRETHHKRFFQEVDENHEKWLKRRRGEQEGAVRLLERLRKRREEVGAAEAAARKIEEQRKAYASEVQRKATAEARRRAIEEAQRRAAVETRRKLGEDGWQWADSEDTAAQTRSILGERTNAAAGTSSQRGADAVGYRAVERVPPGYWPAAGPSSRLPPPQLPVPRPYQQQPRYPSAPQSTGERGPLLQSTSAGTPVNSWLVDVESQTRNAAWVQNHVHHRVRNEEAADSDSGCMATVFCVVGFIVLCHLVVVGYLLQGSTGRWLV